MVGMTPPPSWKTIDAEMYGMMPSAKIVERERPPPSASYSENSVCVPVPAEFLMKSDSAVTSTAGAVMCAPTR